MGTRSSRAAAFACAAAVFALALSSAGSSGDYGPTVVGGTSSNSERKIAVASDGTVYATFTEAAGNSTAVVVQRSVDGGITWQPLPRLGAAEAFRPCVAVDSKGHLHVSWTEFVGPDRQVFYARWEGGPNWTAAERLSDTLGYSGFPALGVDSEDRVHLVWYGFDGATYQVYYRYLEGALWHATVQATSGVQDANNPSIAVGPDDQVHVAFFTYVRGDLDVWYMIGGPAGWNLIQRVNPAGAPSTDPSIAVHLNGTPAIAYAAGANSSLEVRYAERDLAGNWTYNTAVSAHGEGGDNPSLVVDDRGGSAVLYETAGGVIRLRVRFDGGWGEPRQLSSSGDARWVSATWAPWGSGAVGGNITALWTEGNNSGFHVNFTVSAAFPPPAPCKCEGPPWWEGWLVPLAFVSLAAAAAGAMWVASARTRGGGRG